MGTKELILLLVIGIIIPMVLFSFYKIGNSKLTDNSKKILRLLSIFAPFVGLVTTLVLTEETKKASL